MNLEKIGRYIFFLGLVISVASGFVSIGPYGVAGLVVFGIIVGLLNVTGKEVGSFLLGTIALMLVGWTLGSVGTLGTTLQTMLNNFSVFVGGAALIVALREVYKTTKEK